ncbi:MAG: site-2 protease family protein [Planctomycetota bacterium]|nr:site-2 protease family protein [Planctomycetota bacterium]
MGLDIQELVLRLPVVLFSLTIHEFMHAWTALKCGDDTAYRQGRVSLNPLVHLDLLGTVCLIIAPIGWAKPVPVNPSNYGHPRRDDILVSGAGVMANLVVGAACALAMRFFGADLWEMGEAGPIVVQVLFMMSFINFGLAIFNLLPLFPLDGSHILKNLLPLNAAITFVNYRRFGPFALLAFILVNQVVARTYGVSIMGYPIQALVGAFSGMKL